MVKKLFFFPREENFSLIHIIIRTIFIAYKEGLDFLSLEYNVIMKLNRKYYVYNLNVLFNAFPIN